MIRIKIRKYLKYTSKSIKNHIDHSVMTRLHIKFINLYKYPNNNYILSQHTKTCALIYA